jgi:hypothetical protein
MRLRYIINNHESRTQTNLRLIRSCESWLHGACSLQSTFAPAASAETLSDIMDLQAPFTPISPAQFVVTLVSKSFSMLGFIAHF